jgi:phospholipase D1/2
LKILDGSVSTILDDMIPEAAVIDPERPMSPDELVQQFILPGTRRRAAPGFVRLAVTLLCLAALAIIWRSTFFRALVDYSTITGWIALLIGSPFAPLWITGVFAVATLFLAPVTLLIVATGATFGPIAGSTYALCGSLVSALVGYGLGRLAGRETVRRLAGSRLAHVQRQISRHGFISVLFARIVPIAPFTIVNLVAGALQIRARDFLLGTLAGMSPGILAVVTLENQLESAIQDPGIGNIVALTGLAVFFALLGAAFYRWYSTRPVRISNRAEDREAQKSCLR